MKNIILKSCNKNEYPDLIVSCREIDDMKSYFENIPKENKFIAAKCVNISARVGKVGEKIETVLYTKRDNNIYVFYEEEKVVSSTILDNGKIVSDMVVTNCNSTSNEKYVVDFKSFFKIYSKNDDGTYFPIPEKSEFALVDEDIVFKTSWGSEAICLKGSYIVLYNGSDNDFNVVEKGAFESTYKILN